MAAHQAPPSLGFSRQEHWSGLPFPSPVHESEKWKWSRSVMSDSSDPMDCSPPGSSVHGIFQAKVLEWGAIAVNFNSAILKYPSFEKFRPCYFFQVGNKNEHNLGKNNCCKELSGYTVTYIDRNVSPIEIHWTVSKHQFVGLWVAILLYVSC